MKIKNAEFLLSAVSKSQYPDHLPHIAFVGRSNVGKSSLINTLLNRKNFARVSQTPGKTRTINFFEINKEIILVDLPGYGYAKLSKQEKASWGKIMDEYFVHCKNLTHVFILIDIRHEPKADDLDMVNYIRYHNIPISIIATKSDKISKNEQITSITNISKKLLVPKEDIYKISSLKKVGQEEIWEKITSIFTDNGFDITID